MSEQAVEQAIALFVIWDAVTLVWRHYKAVTVA